MSRPKTKYETQRLFSSLRELMVEGVLSTERDCVLGILKRVSTFKFRCPPHRNKWECKSRQFHLSCSGRSDRERSLQVQEVKKPLLSIRGGIIKIRHARSVITFLGSAVSRGKGQSLGFSISTFREAVISYSWVTDAEARI